MSFVSLDVDQLQIMGIRWKQRDELIQSCLISRDTQWSKKQQKLKRNSPRYNWGTSGGFTICWCGSVQSKKKKKENAEKKVGWMGLLWQEWYGLGDKGRAFLQLPAKQALSIFQLKLYFTFSVLELL